MVWIHSVSFAFRRSLPQHPGGNKETKEECLPP